MNRKFKKTNWVPTDKRFVAFIDILGFKDLVMRNSHDDIYKKLSTISNTKKWLEDFAKNKGIEEEIGNAEIYTVSFSDSIIVFSKNDDTDNFRYFIAAITWLFAKSIETLIPMKGAIAYGNISVNKDKQIYFGQPIIDAYLLEEDLKYMGITAHNSIDEYIEENKDKDKMDLVDKFFFECPTPLKYGNIIHKNITWFNKLGEVLNNEGKEQSIAENIIKKYRLLSTGSPRLYIDNTLKVLKEKYAKTMPKKNI